MHWEALVQVTQLAGHAWQEPSPAWKKPALHEQVPSGFELALASLQVVHSSGVVHWAHPLRQMGTSHTGPLYSVPAHAHEQSESCAPLFWHWAEHTQAPLLLSHCPKLGLQLLESQRVSQVVPK